MRLPFHHPGEVLNFWRTLVRPLLKRQPTPFFLFSIVPVQQALDELEDALTGLPIRHWLSCKTQPLRPLLRWWHEHGRPIEVVSEFEFLAALREGFPPERILLNGPAKHHWLPRHARPGLLINFDSIGEVRSLARQARQLGWTIGLRLNTSEEFDPETPEYPTQFGMSGDELREALRRLQRDGLRPQMLHFHLRSNIASASVYERAMTEAARMARAWRLTPRFLDFGGGFPPPHVLTREGRRVDAEFNLHTMRRVYQRALRLFPTAEQLWLENGRWLTARSGVLVVKILDTKQRRGLRHLICDGGRTVNALVSTWEQHALLNLPPRRGRSILTTVTGPTCMAFDQLARRPLPRSLAPGDHLVWLDAGAYHLPWETRFSHGLASVFWHDGRTVSVVREKETFANWWKQWRG